MTDDAKRPDHEPEMDEPVFRPDDANPGQTEPDFVQDAATGETEDWDSDAPGRADLPDGDPASGEPVFSPDEGFAESAEPVFSPDPDPESPADMSASSSVPTEPEYRFDANTIQDADFRPAPDAVEPHFGPDGEEAVSPQDEINADSTVSTRDPFLAESPGIEEALNEESAFEPVVDSEVQDEAASEHDETAATGWVNISPDSDMSVEPLSEKEYTLFDETPAADVAMTPPPRRKLGRTGPVWVLGGIVLVIVAGLVWLAISRLSGAPEEVTLTAAEPTVEQVEEVSPTPEPATSTPEVQPEPTRVRLPVLSNVKVGDTGGGGVMLRADPHLNGGFVAVIPEGESAVVLEPKPGEEPYPVDADGHLWYRVRVPGLLDGDGAPLSGWSASDFFVMDEQ